MVAEPETENSLVTVSERPPWQFKPGVSPNPGGRPKGLTARIREQTDDGAELVDFMLDVLRGKKKAPLRLRMEAAAWLADRGFGKVAQPITGEEGGPLRFTLVLSAAGAPVEDEDERGGG